MLPENEASIFPLAGAYYSPDERVSSRTVDYELGGVALLDTSQGLMARPWTCWLDGADVKLQADGDPVVHTIATGLSISELTFSFDQNMRWAIAYIQNGVLALRWFDTLVNQYVTSTFGLARNPKMALDDKRPTQFNRSDIILAYIRGNVLYWRQQRDRFLIEYTLKTDLFPNTELRSIGMNTVLRMQFELVVP